MIMLMVVGINLIFMGCKFSICQSKRNETVQRIWKQGHGVVNLFIFDTIIAEEAATRKAAMILAIGKILMECHK